jgi:hypothetical protein
MNQISRHLVTLAVIAGATIAAPIAQPAIAQGDVPPSAYPAKCR